jgi:hypothetical protein
MADVSHSASEPKGSFAATFLAVLGGFVIFVLILVVAYVPNRQTLPVGDGVKTPTERKAALAELRGKEQSLATTYGWVDKDGGVVRIPVDRAVDLYLQEQRKK